jgi:16S rRNA G966 N2-methylase RsmD
LNKAILDIEVQEYINGHLKDDVHRIAMSNSPFEAVTAQELAGQIAAKNRSEKKLPTWFNTAGIYYPQLLSVEQSSSERTATYKATLIVGNDVLDLTGGFGVDSACFSKVAETVTHCELLTELSEIAAHNAQVLRLSNIDFLNTDGIEYLQNAKKSFATIYIDPARRGKAGKVFMLKDCSPNVVDNLDLLLAKASRVIIKTSPLLDISAGIRELKNVSEVQIISVKNECKELLFILEPGVENQWTKITSITINESIKKVTFKKSTVEPQQAAVTEGAFLSINGLPTAMTSENVIPSGPATWTRTTEEHSAKLLQNELKRYLYEPDVALLKSGAFYAIGELFNLEKLDTQSQLYTADHFTPKFPGRIFIIENVLTKKELKKQKELTGNVIVRNYPAKADELTKAFKIKSSGEAFLIFTKVRKTGYLILKASILQHY